MNFLISSDDDIAKLQRIMKHCNRCIIKLKKSIKGKHCPELRIALAQLETEPIELTTNTRLGKTWGWADVDRTYYLVNKFMMSISVEAFDYGRKVFNEVVSHELAHLLEFSLRGSSDHGKMWKQLHMWMGGTGSRMIDERDFK